MNVHIGHGVPLMVPLSGSPGWVAEDSVGPERSYADIPPLLSGGAARRRIKAMASPVAKRVPYFPKIS